METPAPLPPFQHALEMMESLRDSGYALVPVEPSKAMLEAGARSGDLTPATVARIYRALLLSAGGTRPVT